MQAKCDIIKTVVEIRLPTWQRHVSRYKQRASIQTALKAKRKLTIERETRLHDEINESS